MSEKQKEEKTVKETTEDSDQKKSTEEDSKEETKELTEETKELTEEEKELTEEEKEIEEEKKLRKESFKKAGEIHKEVVKYIKPLVKIGSKYLDICEKTEEKMLELGGEIGFPTNVCVNEVAAHYSSPHNDESVIKDGDVVKIDIGVSVEGYVADGAFTVSFNNNPKTENIILAVETAVLKGLSLIKPGVNAKEIGKATSKIIKGFGFNPIKKLSGHSIEKWQVHGYKEIPNIPALSGDKFEEGEVFALECFASTGTGNIHHASNCYIYEYDLGADRVPIRSRITRRVVGFLRNKKKTLPFSTRELLKEFKTGKFAIRELINAGKIHEHNVLKEEKGEYIAQFEHTFIVTEDGIEQLT